MQSIQSRLVKTVLRIINVKKMWEVTGDELRKNIEKNQLPKGHEPPKKIQRRFNISKNIINDYCYYVMKPLSNIQQKHILFLHGGGYVHEIMHTHWRYLKKLTDALQCTVIVPIYPLAPGHQYMEVFDMIIPIYRQITSQAEPEDIVIMGDSAGGAMSLALTQLLKEKDLPQPGNIILISPALDWTFSNPEIHEVEKLDPLLAAPALREIGKWYGGEKGSKHYLVSPIYGSLDGLGKISLFTGTNDILYPDAKRFKMKADEKGIKLDYYEYPSMIHAWPLLFFPESRKATQQIIEIIKTSKK